MPADPLVDLSTQLRKGNTAPNEKASKLPASSPIKAVPLTPPANYLVVVVPHPS